MEFHMRTTLTAAAALMISLSPVVAETAAQAPVTFIEKQTTAEMLGSDFVGTPVQTKDGQQIGRIANLVFDQDGRIELAVIGIGGFLGIGEKDVAVPFDAIKAETVNNKTVFTIDVTKDQLKTAPAYQTLNAMAMKERVAEWRAKAAKSWAEIKSRAQQAYDEAKQRVEDTRKPTPEQKQ
jgi:sporulation protein YlmC with PRC-barrel domain